MSLCITRNRVYDTLVHFLNNYEDLLLIEISSNEWNSKTHPL
jgi:hypothetical protein